MKKTAILGHLLHGLGVGLAGHVGTNAAGRSAHHKSNLTEVLAHQGFQHGLIGSAMTPSRKQALKMLFGPEALIPYESAHQLSTKLVGALPSPEARNKALAAMVSAGHHVSDLPVAGDVHKAIQHELAGTTPEFVANSRPASLYGRLVKSLSNHTVTGMETGAQRVVKELGGMVPGAVAVGADAALSPGGIPLGAVVHGGFNLVRQAAPHTPIAKKILAKQFEAGVRGELPSPRAQLVVDHMFSPAVLDPQRIGHKLNAKYHGGVVKQLPKGPPNPALTHAWNELKTDPHTLALRAASGDLHKEVTPYLRDAAPALRDAVVDSEHALQIARQRGLQPEHLLSAEQAMQHHQALNDVYQHAVTNTSGAREHVQEIARELPAGLQSYAKTMLENPDVAQELRKRQNQAAHALAARPEAPAVLAHVERLGVGRESPFLSNVKSRVG